MAIIVALAAAAGLDSFAFAAAIGATPGVTARWRISLLVLLFAAGMPLLGVALGAPLTAVIGGTSGYVVAALVIAVGVWMLVHGAGEDDERQAGRLVMARGMALLGIGMGVSVEELAIGFGLGLAPLPLVPVLLGSGAQAVVAIELGVHLGARVGDGGRDAAGLFAGLLLIGSGLVLIEQQMLT